MNCLPNCWFLYLSYIYLVKHSIIFFKALTYIFVFFIKLILVILTNKFK